MFVHMKNIPARTADALDLLIEFATLGEYGLEYPETQAPETGRGCAEGRRRPVSGPPRTTGKDGVRSPRALQRSASRGLSHRHQAGGQPRSGRVTDSSLTTAGNPDFAQAMRPPRIKLNFS